MVYAIRVKEESALKRAAYHVYYRALRYLANVDIPLDAGDFCVISRRALDTLNALPERNRFVRGMRTWIGYRQIGMAYERQARAAGEPKYTLRSLMNLALDGVVNFPTSRSGCSGSSGWPPVASLSSPRWCFCFSI